MTFCDPLEAECPLELTEDDCRTLINLLRHVITPDREPVLPRPASLRVILEKLEFCFGGRLMPPPALSQSTRGCHVTYGAF
jgi:hypothetical protein